MAHRALSTLAAGICLAALMVGSAGAQSAGSDRRLERVERDLRTLQTIVMQAQATGQPVLVRPEGPDPTVTALQQRMDDLELTLQRVNSQVETLGHDMEQARRADLAVETERRAQTDLLNQRLARMEAQIAALTQATTAADPSLGQPPPVDGGISLDGRTRDPRFDATGRAQAADTGVLGGRTTPPPPPPPPAPTANDLFNEAKDLFTGGQAVAAGDAFQDFITRYPTSPRTPEAYYWLGESYYAQRGYQNATAAYASALRNRPTTAWAPAAMVRLAQSLAQSNQTAQACAALTEFDQRYAAKASAAIKSNAAAVRTRARCT